MSLHPDHLFLLAQTRVAARSQQAARRRHAMRPRPPGRIRRVTAMLLVRAAVRLSDEPVVVIPQRV